MSMKISKNEAYIYLFTGSAVVFCLAILSLLISEVLKTKKVKKEKQQKDNNIITT